MSEPQRLRDVTLMDCPKCGHFQAWPCSDSVCGGCGWPDPEQMRWHREFEALSSVAVYPDRAGEDK